MKETVQRLAQMLKESKRTVFFGGAGVSTESGIPDFRSAHGLYGGAKGKSYEDMLHIRYFLSSPDEFWTFYKNVMLYPDAKPNAAHAALARLEGAGKLDCVLTQNIDGLHQAAGSKRVWELHGSVKRNRCAKCGARYDEAFVLASEGIPKCEKCGGTVRPCVVLYGESLDRDVLEGAIRDISRADVLIIAGTSLAVYPAAMLPDYFNGRELVLVNKTPTARDGIATLTVYGDVAEVCRSLSSV